MLFDRKTSSKQIEARIAKLEEAVVSKEDQVKELEEINKLLTEQLKSTNSVLTDQLKFRWSSHQSLIAFVPGVLGAFFTFGLACAFGYQIYKADEAKKLTEQIRISDQQLQDERDQINKQVKLQSNVMGQLAKVVSDLDIGQREFAYGRYSRTAAKAEEAERVIDEARDILVSERTNEIKQTASAAQKSTPINLVTPLQGAVDEMRVSSYELSARAHFSLFATSGDADELAIVRRVGEDIKKYYPERWEGYHYIGIGYSENGMYDKAVGPLEQAAAISLKNNEPIILDLLNLAETYFMLGEYSKSEQSALKYLARDRKASGDIKVVSSFFVWMSKYMQDGKPENIASFKDILEYELYVPESQGTGFLKSATLSELVAKATKQERKIPTAYSSVAIRQFRDQCRDKSKLQELQKRIPELRNDIKRQNMLDTIDAFTKLLRYH